MYLYSMGNWSTIRAPIGQLNANWEGIVSQGSLESLLGSARTMDKLVMVEKYRGAKLRRKSISVTLGRLIIPLDCMIQS